MTTLLKPILQKVTLTKQTPPLSTLSKSPNPSSASRSANQKAGSSASTVARSNPRKELELARIQAALLGFGQGFVHVMAQIGHWAWANLEHQARVTNDVMHRRPPRFETSIAVGTFAFIVVAAVAGFLMLGGVRL
jgi:hypothetical protein